MLVSSTIPSNLPNTAAVAVNRRTYLKLLYVCEISLGCKGLCQGGDLHIGIQLSQSADTSFHSEIRQVQHFLSLLYISVSHIHTQTASSTFRRKQDMWQCEILWWFGLSVIRENKMFLLVVRRIFWETGCSTKSWAFPSAQIPFSKCTDTILNWAGLFSTELSWAFPSTQIPCWPELNLLGTRTVTEGTYCWC